MTDIKETIQGLYSLKTYLASKTIEEHGPARESLIGMQKVVDSTVNLLKEQEPVEPKIQTSHDGNGTWWYVCGMCNTAINPNDKFCHECGKKVKLG